MFLHGIREVLVIKEVTSGDAFKVVVMFNIETNERKE